MAQDEHTRIDDAAFAADALAALPAIQPSAALQARLLADFERATAPRTPLLRRLLDALWPGMPAWQPAAAVALSLIVGLTAGALMPTAGVVDTGDQSEAQVADSVSPALDMLGDL